MQVSCEIERENEFPEVLLGVGKQVGKGREILHVVLSEKSLGDFACVQEATRTPL